MQPDQEPRPRRAARAALVRFETLSPARWRAGFDALAQLGFDAVDLPLVWSAHERRDRSFDFERGPLAIGEAIRAARAAGLTARVRLGPRCVEADAGFGVPARVLADPSCLARNARRGAVLEPIGLVPTPAPSMVSAAFLTESTRWIRAAVSALGEVGFDAIDAVVLGPGTFAPLRADAVERDHHTDGGALPTDPIERARVGSSRALRYYEALFDSAIDAGAPREKLRASLVGTASSAAAGAELAARWPLDVASPFATVGSDVLWSETFAATRAPRGAHFDVACGCAPFARPLRNRDAVAAARVVLAAGAASITARVAWAGSGWVGALLDDAGAPRRAASRWRALFDECAAVPPAAVGEDELLPIEQPSLPWLAPVSRGWLAQFGLLEREPPDDALARCGLASEPTRAVLARLTGETLVVLSRVPELASIVDDGRRWLSQPALTVAPGAVLTLRKHDGGVE